MSEQKMEHVNPTIESLRSRLAEVEAENARLVAGNKARDEFLRGHRYKHSEVDGYINLCESQIATLKARLAEADALRETRAKELSYVVEACTAALVIRTTHESRDALRDLRAWATNRIDAHLARQT